jgi:hypothetical protein
MGYTGYLKIIKGFNRGLHRGYLKIIKGFNRGLH